MTLTVGTHDPNRDNSKYRLSDAGRCRLMRYWKRQGKVGTRDIPGTVALQMQAGNLIHAYIETAMQRMGCLVASEAPLEDDHRLGHFDMVLLTPDGQYILYDIKTITNKKAFYRAKYGDGADDQHIAQLVSYGLMYEDRLDALRMAYVVRDTMEIQEIPIEMARHEDDVLSDWAILINAWDQQIEPDPNPQRWECAYCAYAHDCPSAIR
ncbi:MAG: PD-(D/E)XK nuclease family protein [Planctomycetia bacterium]